MYTSSSQSEHTQDSHSDEQSSLERTGNKITSIIQPTQPIYATRHLPRVLRKFDLFVFSALTTLVLAPIVYTSKVGYSSLFYWTLALLFLLPQIIVSRWISLRIAAQGGQYHWFTLLGGAQWGTVTRLFLWLGGLFSIIASIIGCLIVVHTYTMYFFNTSLKEIYTIILLIGIVTVLSILPLNNLKYILRALLIATIMAFLIIGCAGFWQVINGHPSTTSLSTLPPGPQNIEFFGLAIWGLIGGDASFVMTSEVKDQVYQKARGLGNFIWWSYALIFGLYIFATLGTTLIVSQPNNPAPLKINIQAIQTALGGTISSLLLFLCLLFFIAKAVVFVIMGSRLLFMASKEGILPEKLTYINHRGTPIASILVQMGVCAAFLLILYMLLTGISNFNPITTQRGLPFYLLLRAIGAVLWLLAGIQFFVMIIRYVLRVRHKAHTSNRDERVQGREGTWILTLSIIGIATLLIATQQIITHSWTPQILSDEHWSFTVAIFTLVSVVIGWLCAEIPRKHTLLTTLRKVNAREQALRNQLEDAYHEQQILVAQQQELLSAVDQLYRENALAAVTDPITGLPNHRAIISAIDSALHETDQAQETLALLFVDLDRFKQVNDSWGHPAGDAVLHEVGTRLKNTIGPTNFTGRYGGEEFAVILRDCNVSAAVEIAERIRLNIMEKPFLWFPEDASTPIELTITASIGISIYPYHGDTREALLEQADRAMYRAKQSGRNRVCVVLTEEQSRQILTVSGLGSFSSEEICTARALLAAMQAYDQETYEHAQRMVSLSEATARHLKCGSEEMHNVRLAAMFHDIGKIGVPNSILRKPGPLTESEWEVIRRHPDIGRRILARAGGPFVIVAYIIGAHHERWDGAGYPGGLSGEQIPLSARILSVVDAYDTMVSGRVYREAISDEEARQELLRCAGSQFDPNVVEAFLQILDKFDGETHEPFLSQRAG